MHFEHFQQNPRWQVYLATKIPVKYFFSCFWQMEAFRRSLFFRSRIFHGFSLLTGCYGIISLNPISKLNSLVRASPFRYFFHSVEFCIALVQTCGGAFSFYLTFLWDRRVFSLTSFIGFATSFSCAAFPPSFQIFVPLESFVSRELGRNGGSSFGTNISRKIQENYVWNNFFQATEMGASQIIAIL